MVISWPVSVTEANGAKLRRADLKMVRLQEIWERDFCKESHNAFHFFSITSSCRFGKHVAYKVDITLTLFIPGELFFSVFFLTKFFLTFSVFFRHHCMWLIATRMKTMT